jgi:hypothetical protein
MADTTAEPIEVLAGSIERVTFHNASNGFCVLRIKARGHRDLVTVVGHAAEISAGEWVTVSGVWVNDREHGQQFKASFLRSSAPTTAEEIEKYLGSGMIRGIGPNYASKLVEAFGAEVFEVIEQATTAMASAPPGRCGSSRRTAMMPPRPRPCGSPPSRASPSGPPQRSCRSARWRCRTERGAWRLFRPRRRPSPPSGFMNPLLRLLGAAASNGLLTGQIIFSTAFVGACELPNWIQAPRQVNACRSRSPALALFFPSGMQTAAANNQVALAPCWRLHRAFRSRPPPSWAWLPQY